MRTTISIADDLLRRAKEASLRRHCTLGEVIEDALKASLIAQPKSSRRREPADFQTFKGTGLQPGVDLNTNSALLDLMEER